MPVAIQCPHCKHCFNVGEQFVGSRIRCAKCPGMIDIPAAKTESAAVPELTADVVKTRLERIAARIQPDPLESTVELRYLHAGGHLDDAEAKRRLVDILGEEHAARLLSSEQDERRKAIDALVPSGR